MSEQLAAAFRCKKTFFQLEAHLLKQSRLFYHKGFDADNLTSSQMAAVDNKLQIADSFEKAQEGIADFLKNQKEKLEAKDSTGSWLQPIEGTGTTDTLGDVLLEWIMKEKYLPAGIVGDLDRLAALRRFWCNVHGMYRYHKIFGEDMPLNEEELS